MLLRRDLSAGSSDGATVHFQILELDKQVFVWVGHGVPRLGNLHAATPTKFDRVPSVTTLFGGGANDPAATIAQRLSLKLGKPVLLSYNLPANTPLLQAFAEAQLIRAFTASKD
eukprot:jgi/Chlat1/9042/Chrsp94S08303